MATKLHNPFFPAAFEDYLIVNGYREAKSVTSPNTTYFFNGTKAVEIKRDSLIVSSHYDEEPGQHASGYAQEALFTGLAGLDEFKFMLLMHVTGAVPLKHFYNNAKQDAAKENLFEMLGRALTPLAV